MPKESRGDKLAVDVITDAVLAMPISDGKAPENSLRDDRKDRAAQALGRKGGVARAASSTPERRTEIAKTAAAKRWSRS